MNTPINPLADFGNGSMQNRKEATKLVKQWTRAIWGLQEDESVFVAELACGETDCPDKETVIAAFLHGERKEIRISKAVQDLTEADVSAASGG